MSVIGYLYTKHEISEHAANERLYRFQCSMMKSLALLFQVQNMLSTMACLILADK